MNRHFYRCTGCLQIVTLDSELPTVWENFTTRRVGICDDCDSPLEYMGRTFKERLVVGVTECKCDDRCTSAKGPNCNCSCGGKNHGAGMAGYVSKLVDRGGVPRIAMPTAASKAKALAQFAEFREARDSFRARLQALLSRRDEVRFLPASEFATLRALQAANVKMSKARTHAARMKAVQAGLTA